MITILSVGNFCSSIADKLNYPQYSILKVGTNLIGKNCLKLPVFKNAEEYENYKISFENFLNSVEDEISVFVDGSEAISGIILKLLETIKQKNITVYYVRSDLQLLSPIEILQDKIAFNILQEYARSGLFNKIFLLDKLKIENIIGNLSILDYEDKMSSMIASTIHMINVYDNIQPVLTNSTEKNKICRIATVGLSDIGNSEIKWFFDIQNINEINYYFAINSNTLKREQKLLQIIKKQVKDAQSENTTCSFAVYETDYNENYVYCTAQTKLIQQRDST